MKKIFAYVNDVLNSYRDAGLLLFRAGLGGMFMWHGFPKVSGGIEKWTELGRTMSTFGIDFAPAFWGFMSGFAEFFGGFLIMAGLFYRIACLLLVFNLAVAFTSLMLGGKGLLRASQALEVGLGFFAALFVGPGRYSVDEYLGLNDTGIQGKLGKERCIAK